MNNITVERLKPLVGKVTLIDVRTPAEFSGGHIPFAKNIPINNIINVFNTAPSKQITYYVVCASGGRSIRVANYLNAQGYNVVNVLGGTSAYKEKFKLN